MSIVKYTNKKTGVVTLYESTSHYDPETKQSRPVRKYLGREDPITGELIPSTRKRGKKKDNSQNTGETSKTSENSAIAVLKARYEKELSSRDAIINEQASTIRELKTQKASVFKRLSSLLQELSD
jgi:hypothetical protein